jgi:3-(3-hydroxy-phenyl)propionate hydroxylase
MFDQPELEKILRKRMLEQDSVDFRGNVEVLGIDPGTSGIADVDYVDRDSGERSTLRARYVLACDGANSLGRQAIGSTMQDLRFEQRWLVIDIETDADLQQWEGVHQVCDTTRAATYMRVGVRRYRWEFQLLPGETVDDYRTLEDVVPLIRPWTRDLGVEQLELVRIAEYTFRAMIADQWRKANIFLLGDAAHLTPPFIGQGMGAGLRDAMNLAWKVAGVWHGRLPETVLDTYEAERKPHARTVIRLAKLMGVLMTRGGTIGDALRRLVAPRIGFIPALGARVSHSETAPLRGSAWASTSRRDRLSGYLCPNSVVTGGLRFDDIAQGRFVFVTDADLDGNATKQLSSRTCDVLHVEDGTELSNWLRHGRARAALVRPDGTVMESGTASTVLGTALTSLKPTP